MLTDPAVTSITIGFALSPHGRRSASRTPHRESATSNATQTRPHTVTAETSHSYATRLINNDVPQEVVRRLLDHTSHITTARYARLADTTIREQWERAQKVHIRGGLPKQKSCPHANACLTCPLFVTTAEFLPQHHQQLAATRALITRAETDGHIRLAEMNRSDNTHDLPAAAQRNRSALHGHRHRRPRRYLPRAHVGWV